jgi:hypothetical protein
VQLMNGGRARSCAKILSACRWEALRASAAVSTLDMGWLCGDGLGRPRRLALALPAWPCSAAGSRVPVPAARQQLRSSQQGPGRATNVKRSVGVARIVSVSRVLASILCLSPLRRPGRAAPHCLANLLRSWSSVAGPHTRDHGRRRLQSLGGNGRPRRGG